MRRPIFRREQTQQQGNQLDLTKRQSTRIPATDLQMRLREPRSNSYLDLLNQLDVGEKVISQTEKQQIVDAIKEEFSDLSDPTILVGVVAACYLGHPYEVHTVDLETATIQHYRVSDPLPIHLEKARSLALHPSYAFIEVYADCLRVVDKQGGVSVIK